MKAKDLSKQQERDAEKAMQQPYFQGNLARKGNANTATFFIIEKAKETISDSSHIIFFILNTFTDDPSLI